MAFFIHILRVLATLSLFFSSAANAQTLTTLTSTTTIWSTHTVYTSTSTITGLHTTITSSSTHTTTITLSIYSPPIPSVSSSSMSTLTPVSSTSTASTTQTSHGPYAKPSLAPAVLNSTNYFRAQHQAAPLIWNSSLATYAQNHSSHCIWEHSGGPNGENLALSYASPQLSIQAWAAEEAHYNYRHAAFSESTGHFTQLVWKDTVSVGCGATLCPSKNSGDDAAHGWYLVCEYWPPGNVKGGFKVQVTKPGESVDGVLGFGGAGRVVGGGLWTTLMVVGLVVAGVL